MAVYKEDLAYIHDVGFGGFARAAAPGLLEILRRRGVARGLVVDLGCGSGLWARELSDAGYDVLGIDISRAMIARARRRVPEGRFRTGSFLKVKLPTCDVVTALGECFNYLFDDTIGINELARLFRHVYHALRPGGMFIFDVAEPGRGDGPRLKHSQGTDWAVLVEVDEDKDRRRLTRRITTFRKVGRLYRRALEVHELQLYDRSAIVSELRGTGFRVRTLGGYSPQRFPKASVGFLARKPSKPRGPGR
jgi:SAM-dependent methyltransferase